jgi:hypothetical protein
MIKDQTIAFPSKTERKVVAGDKCTVAEHLSSIHMALGLILRTRNKKYQKWQLNVMLFKSMITFNLYEVSHNFHFLNSVLFFDIGFHYVA